MLKSLTPIILLIASIGLFFMVIDPQYKDIKSKQFVLSQYNEALGKSKDLDNRRIQLSDIYKSIPEESITNLDKMLPTAVDNIRLILDISTIAGLHGMKLKNIKISSGPSSDEKNNPLVVDERKYGTIGIGFSVTSSYNEFLNFLNDLEHNLRVTDIVSLNIRPNKMGIYDFTLDLKTYWMKQ